MSSDLEHHRRLTAAPPEVQAWRGRLLREAGLAPDLAGRVAADPDFDVHAVIELIERGCPPHLAVRILAPLESGDEWVRS